MRILNTQTILSTYINRIYIIQLSSQNTEQQRRNHRQTATLRDNRSDRNLPPAQPPRFSSHVVHHIVHQCQPVRCCSSHVLLLQCAPNIGEHANQIAIRSSTWQRRPDRRLDDQQQHQRHQTGGKQHAINEIIRRQQRTHFTSTTTTTTTTAAAQNYNEVKILYIYIV